MYLLKLEKEQLLKDGTLIISEDTEYSIRDAKKMLEESSDGQCFICDKSGKYKGIITNGDYKRVIKESEKKNIAINQKSKVIFDKDDIESKIRDFQSIYPKISLFPIIDENRTLICVYKSKKLDMNIGYKYLTQIYRKDSEYGICALKRFFQKYNNQIQFVIWGVNELSLELAEEITNIKIDGFCGIYDTKESIQSHTNEVLDFNNYMVSPVIAESIKDARLDKINMMIIAEFSEPNLLTDQVEDSDYKFVNILEFLKLVYLESPNYYINLKKNELNKKGVSLYTIHIPTYSQMNCKGDEWIFKGIYEKPRQIRSDGEEQDFLECCKKRDMKPQIVRKGMYRCFADFSSKYINYLNGERLTIGQPDDWDNTIYLFGNCVASSIFAEDSDTVASQLQRILNNTNSGIRWRVVAYGSNAKLDPKYTLRWVEDIKWKQGDFAFLIGTDIDFTEYDYCLTDEFAALYQEKNFILDIPTHCNFDGYETIANTLYEKFVKKNRKEIPTRSHLENKRKEQKHSHVNTLVEENDMLREYCNSLLQYKRSETKGRIGSIVMNCNPFTLGHRYLIEQASKEVELLYIFVVEEDKSIFPFKDRIALVRAGTKDLDNVVVMPSGKFIISSVTFPSYFQKEHITTLDNSMDASADLDIFGQYIAKTLNISIRFVGEEPLDIVTNMYNRQMKEILPQYGIEVKIIKRKEVGGDVISASRVRAQLKEKEFKKIAELVPYTTLEYLKRRYS